MVWIPLTDAINHISTPTGLLEWQWSSLVLHTLIALLLSTQPGNRQKTSGTQTGSFISTLPMHKGHFYSAAVFALEIAFYSQIAQVLGESQWLRLKWMLLCAPPMAARVLVSAWPHRLTLCALLPLIPALLVLLATHNVPAHLVFHKTSPATILIAVDIYLLARQLLALLHLSVARITYLWVFRYLRGETGPQPPTIDPEELLGRFSTQLDAERRRAEPLLARAIVRTFAFDLCASSALQLAVYASQVVLPVLVARILFQLGRLDTAMPDALFALAAYATVALAAAVVEQNQIDHRDKVALKMQVALSAAVHRAAVRGSTLEDPLCGTDHPQALSAHVAKLCGNIWLPLRVVSGLYVFYRQVGWAVLPGIAFILVYLPIRSHLIRARTAAQAASTRASGERTRMLAQMLENIVPLRLLGWDARLRMDIERLREGAELRHTVASSVANALLALARTASRSGGPLVSLAIYSVLRHFSDTEFVTTEKVYIVQSILRELFPLLIDIPHAFDSWWAARLPHEQLARVLFAAPAEAASKMEWPSLAAAGQMVAVVGAVGAGKSSLLAALLDDLGSAAFVSQTPWLMACTVRSNIVFGQRYDPQWFARVVVACELAHDLEQWAEGDLTVVGANGATLSGGQRMRVALARAVYSRAPVCLLDDFLPMVDAQVARRIIDNVLVGPQALLQGTTRVVVASHPEVLRRADEVWLVDGGRVRRAPRPADTHAPVAYEPQEPTPPQSSARPSSSTAKQADTPDPKPSETYLRPIRYMVRMCGTWPIVLHAATVALQCVFARNAQLWLAKPIPLTAMLEPTATHLLCCLVWWSADVVLEFLAQLWTDVVWRRAMFTGSHRQLLAQTARSSPNVGQLLDLFTRGQQDIDTRVPQQLASLATFGIKLGFESWVILTFHPVLIGAMGAVIVLMSFIMRVSREPLAGFIRETHEAAPLVRAQFRESASGSVTLRAFGAFAVADRRLFAALSRAAQAQRMQDSIETWIDLSISVLRELANITVFGVAVASHTDPAYLSLVNLSVTFHLARLQHLIRHSHMLRSCLLKAHRYIEFADRAPDTRSFRMPDDGWPKSGAIRFDRVRAAYDQPLGWALDMSFEIAAGQHVGVVGRTGAGKTSIVMALAGLLPVSTGSIAIDGVDITMIEPSVLRSRMVVVPQDPYVLGTVRDNLPDTPDAIRVLEMVGLDAQLDESPAQWSLGQKQLLCLARILLSENAPIVVLDEATAHIGPEHSAQLHQLIRTWFRGKTVLTIAHRLESVMECDLVMVVEDGRVCESGAPAELVSTPGSRFARLARCAQIDNGGLPTPPKQ